MSSWRAIQKLNFTQCEPLFDFLELDASQRKKVSLKNSFPLNLPLRLAQKIEKNTIDDPLFRQFVPLLAETQTQAHYCADPVQESRFTKLPKLLHKYPKRALLLLSSACAMHCRFCFRKSFPYEKNTPGYADELFHIANDTSLEEIILSGGDPLSLSNKDLQALLNTLYTFSHIKRLRFHTRFPIGIPERIDEEFLTQLKASSQQIYFVIHCNHPRELDDDVLTALKRVQQTGAVLLSQTVLLKGVNDSLDTLQALCERLMNAGVLPYYLHQLDPVSGASHFEVSEEKGRQLIEQLTQRLSGYGVPKYVKEVAGLDSKMAV